MLCLVLLLSCIYLLIFSFSFEVLNTLPCLSSLNDCSTLICVYIVTHQPPSLSIHFTISHTHTLKSHAVPNLFSIELIKNWVTITSKTYKAVYIFKVRNVLRGKLLSSRLSYLPEIFIYLKTIKNVVTTFLHFSSTYYILTIACRYQFKTTRTFTLKSHL